MNGKAIVVAFVVATLLLSGVAYADPSGVYNSPSNPDTTGFTYYYIPQLQTQNGMIDYADPQLLFKIVLKNTLTQPNLLKDSSGNLFDTYNFADLGAVATNISGVTHYVLKVDTNSTTTTQPVGVTESKSGVYHYGSITLPDGMVIKFWVVDTTTAGDYNMVFVDLNADQIIDYTSLGVGSYFTITDPLGGKMEIVISDIASNGSYIEIYNAYDNLVSGAPSPIDGTPLQPVMKPHWVIVGINTKNIANVKNVDFYVEAQNGSLREVKPSDFYIGKYNATSGVIDAVVLLGDYSYNGVFIPADRTVYALAHLQPVTYDVTKTYDPNTNETILTITLHNNAGMSLGAGYITIDDIAPADALSWIQKTLNVVSGGATASVEAGLNGVNLVLKLNSLPVGDTKIVISYKYVTPLVDIQKTVNENNEMIKKVYNITQNNVVQMLNTLVKSSQEVLSKLQNGSDIAPLKEQLDQINENVQNNAKAIGNLNDQLQSIQTQLAQISTSIQSLQTTLSSMNIFDVNGMLNALKNEIKLTMNLINNLNAQLGAGTVSVPTSASATNGTASNETMPNGTGGTPVAGGNTYTAQLQTQLSLLMNELNAINTQVMKLNDKTSPFIVMMYYNKVLLIENEVNNLMLSYQNYELQNAIAGNVNQMNGKLGTLISMVTNMQNSVLTSVNRVPTVVSSSIEQKVAPLQKDLKNVKLFLLIVLVLEVVAIVVAFRNSKKEEAGEGAGMVPPEMGGMMPGAGQFGGQMSEMGGMMPGAGQNENAGQFGGYGGFGMPEQ